MRRIGKGLLQACGVCVISFLFLFLFWFLGNYQALLPAKTATAAVQSVIAKYEANPPERLDIQRLNATRDFPQGTRWTYQVSAGGRPIARVTLLDFLGLGWQQGQRAL